MKSFYFSVLMALSFLMAMPVQAQTDRSLLIHFKDKTTKEIPVAQIDSICFEKEEAIPHFEVTMDDIHPLYAEFTVAPLIDRTATFNVMCVEKSVYDKYDSDAAIIADDIKFFTELAQGYGCPISEIISQFVVHGDYNDFQVGLLPDAEYVMWVYGLTLEGVQTTPMQKVFFRTAKATHIPNKIAIDVKRSQTTIDAVYTPDDNNLHYTCGMISLKDALAEGLVPTRMQQALSNQVVDYVLGGEPLNIYLEERTEKGQSNYKFESIDPSMKYFITAAYLDNECCLCSDVTIVTSTPEGGVKSLPSTQQFIKQNTTVKRILSDKFQVKDQIYRMCK